jgi:putative tricarboxylic transport membrane protein
MWRRTTALSALAALVVSIAACASDDDAPGNGNGNGDDGPFQPDGTVTMVVPAPPGGGSDIIVRALADYYRASGDADVVVENTEGYDSYLQLRDRHHGDPTYVVGATAGSSYIWAIELGLDWDWTDFTQLAIVAQDTQYLVVPANSPFQTFDDLIATAGERRLTVGQAGSGGVNTIATRQLEAATDRAFEPVIYESGGEQLAALLGNDLDFTLLPPGVFIDYVETGDVRALVGLSADPMPSGPLADVPTAADVGLTVEFVAQFRSFIAAGGISNEARQYWIDVLEAWVQSQAYHDYVENSLVAPMFVAGADADQYIRNAESAFRELMD